VTAPVMGTLEAVLWATVAPCVNERDKVPVLTPWVARMATLEVTSTAGTCAPATLIDNEVDAVHFQVPPTVRPTDALAVFVSAPMSVPRIVTTVDPVRGAFARVSDDTTISSNVSDRDRVARRSIPPTVTPINDCLVARAAGESAKRAVSLLHDEASDTVARTRVATETARSTPKPTPMSVTEVEAVGTVLLCIDTRIETSNVKAVLIDAPNRFVTVATTEAMPAAVTVGSLHVILDSLAHAEAAACVTPILRRELPCTCVEVDITVTDTAPVDAVLLSKCPVETPYKTTGS
jgi:hypothetical protein